MANYPVPYVPRNLGLIFNLTEIQSLRSLNAENLGILWDKKQVNIMKELQVEKVYPITRPILGIY